jgi:transposase
MVQRRTGWSCEQVAAALFMDDDTIRQWHSLFVEDGFDGLLHFASGGSVCRLSADQQLGLASWMREVLPRSTREVGAWIEAQFGLGYTSRSGLITLLHRLGFDYHKPEVIPLKLDVAKQQAFIDTYQNMLNTMSIDEAVMCVDAVHPTHAARPSGLLGTGWRTAGD